MKKAILTFGLFSLMMVLTSFTSASDIGGQKVPESSNRPFFEIGGQRVPGDKNPLGIGGQKVPESSNKPFTFDIGGQKVPESSNKPLA